MPNAEPRPPVRLSLEQLRKQAKDLLRAGGERPKLAAEACRTLASAGSLWRRSSLRSRANPGSNSRTHPKRQLSRPSRHN